MDDRTIRLICKERLESWGKILGDNESTPVVLVGVGHNGRSGITHVVTCEGIANEDIVSFLEAAIEELKTKQ